MKSLRKITASTLSVLMLGTSLFTGQAAFASDNLEATKVLSLPFEENLEDSSGKGNNGTIIGSNYSYVDGIRIFPQLI